MSFYGIRTALSSLQAQRRAMEIVGQNVANVATEGYSRQRVTMKANAGSIVPAVFARPSGIGGGVLADDITRVRDQFLEVRGNQEHAVDAGLRQTAATLERVELAFGEPGDDGLGAQIADFFAGWDDVANRPEDTAARSQLVERARTLADGIAQIDATLGMIRTNAIEQLQASVVDVNATAVQIADLNQRIQVASSSGLSPNDLMDQRDLATARLASTVGAVARPGGDGTVDVFVGGTALVRGARPEELQVVIDGGPGNPVSIRWAKDDQPASVTAEAGALLTTANDIVPRYRAAVAAVADQIRDQVNAIHSTGVGLDGLTGRDFFANDGTGRLGVAAAVVADLEAVAASGSATAPKDGSRARAIAALTGPDSTYRDLVVRLGVESQTAARRVEIQGAITTQIDGAREAVAGVDIDEEMTEMLTYQRAYDAAARLMSVIDATLDTLINRTGSGR